MNKQVAVGQSCDTVELVISPWSLVSGQSPVVIRHLAFAICHLAFVIWHLAFGIFHLPFDIRHLTFEVSSELNIS